MERSICEKKKKLLITGASGFLGSRIVDFYTGKYQVYAPVHNQLDITDERNVAHIFHKYKPDIVIHCAAISDVGRCEKEPENSWNINVNGSIHIAKASKEVQAKCIICSSDQVYFGSGLSRAHEEEEQLQPSNLYGQEKLKAEQECLKINPGCVLLRLSWMYDTETKNEREHGDFFRTLRAQMRKKDVMKFPVHDKRGITNVREVLKNLEKTFQIPGGVYNFGSPNEKDTYTMLCEVFANAGLDTGRLQKNMEAFCGNPRNLCMCQKKINGYGIFFSSTAEGLSKTLARTCLKISSCQIE